MCSVMGDAVVSKIEEFEFQTWTALDRCHSTILTNLQLTKLLIDNSHSVENLAPVRSAMISELGSL